MKCVRFKPYSGQSSYLIGWADILIPKWANTTHRDFPVFQKDGGIWIKLPSDEYLDGDGEKKYRNRFQFDDKELFTAFVKKASEAVNTFMNEQMKESSAPSYQGTQGQGQPAHEVEQVPF